MTESIIEGGKLVKVHGGSGLAVEGVPNAKRGMIVHSASSHADGAGWVCAKYRLTIRAVPGTDLWRVVRCPSAA